MRRGRVVSLALTLLWLGAGCSGSGRPQAAAAPWTGARALTAGEDAPFGVVSDGKEVLFTTGRTQVGENALRSVAVDGGTTSRLVAVTPGGRTPNGRVALDGELAYVAAGSGIVRQPVGGGVGTVVVRDRPALVDEVVVAGADLWWTTYQYGEPGRIEVARVPKAGGPVEVVAVNVAGGLGRPSPEPGGAAVLSSPIGALRVRAGRPPEVLVSAQAAGGAVTRLAVDSQRLYLLTAGARHRLLAVPLTGGPPAVLANDVGSESDLLVMGGEVVYFAGPSGTGGGTELRAVPTTGGPARTIASGRYAAGDLAAAGDGRVVFSADGQVWMAALR